MIGPHCQKLQNLNFQRAFAASNGWGIFQTHFGNPKSFDMPSDVVEEYTESGTAHWAWHSAYIASINPSPKSRDGCGMYLRRVLRYAARFRIHSIVVHAGPIVGVPVETVVEGMRNFIRDFDLANQGTKIAIEFGASVCGFDLNPTVFTSEWSKSPTIGWCLDLAHAYASGVPRAELLAAIEQKPPWICHANYPGSAFGSSRDVHGWRFRPAWRMEKKVLVERTAGETAATIEWYDSLIRLLHSKSVPLIIEGSGFPEGNTTTDIELVRRICQS